MKTWQMRLSPNRSAKRPSAVGAGFTDKKCLTVESFLIYQV
jgi:hypothetical protein